MSILQFISVVDLQGSRGPLCEDDALVRDNCYEHVIASRLGSAIGAKYVRVLIREVTTAAKKQLQMS